MKENLYLETKENFFAQRKEDVCQYQPLDESRIAFRVSPGLSSTLRSLPLWTHPAEDA